MPGQANHCDKPLLQLGDACIIEVNEVNSPTGIWEGVVGGVEDVDGRWLRVRATIKGGEHDGREPSVNYGVLPDTATVRDLVSRLKRSQSETVGERLRANHFLELHVETVRRLKLQDG